MKSYLLTGLTDQVLLNGLDSLVAHDRSTTAQMLAHLAEVEVRRLYVPAGYPSMYNYCVEHLRMSEDVALKRIQAARAALQFPAIFTAVADGRLHLSAVGMLATHLTQENAADLLVAAEHRTKSQLELLLAERFPKADVASFVRPIAHALPSEQAIAPQSGLMASAPTAAPPCENGIQPAPGQVGALPVQLAARPVGMTTPEPFSTPAGSHQGEQAARAKIKPLSPQRFALQATIEQETHDLLREAQALLGHSVPSGDVKQVLRLALSELVQKLRKRKFAETRRPRASASPRKSDERCIPAAIRREVAQRDGGQCTFVSGRGHRRASRIRLEYDHVQPIARGGLSTAANLRLRCRAHNQYAAEREFGAAFMQRKRESSHACPVAAAGQSTA